MEISGAALIWMFLMMLLVSILCGFSLVGIIDKKLSHVEIKIPSVDLNQIKNQTSDQQKVDNEQNIIDESRQKYFDAINFTSPKQNYSLRQNGLRQPYKNKNLEGYNISSYPAPFEAGSYQQVKQH